MAGKGKELNPRGSVAALLGAKVRRARERKGLTQSQLAGTLFTSPNRVAQIELATDPPTFKMMKQIEQVLDIDEELEELWHLISKQPYPSWSARFLALQGKARLIYEFAHLIPGLLQTPGYARALMEAAQVYSEFEIDERLAPRMARQEALDGGSPPWLWVVLGEAALRQVVGSREVMREQLEHVLRMAQRPRVHVQVLPFHKADAAALSGSISIGQLPDGDRYAYTEGNYSGILVEEQESVTRQDILFDRLQARALDQEASAEAIREAVKEHST
ncbi:helix-turn-helix domain-containing protein [Streptomyces bohaiensis]|uniref:Helix-turn-helix transcriptional regulator n=1 Tax=Streptomyces bohaiensis TaxID=1431344 RepID=A0ABX1C6A4_9ACTN|nr:helix-turn-helix transcriptional regulator [Streptomyces bohaiensis]NJQ14716.1 helix-turn-helix transcriptional regulator [Streptomyces bohaiensis]